MSTTDGTQREAQQDHASSKAIQQAIEKNGRPLQTLLRKFTNDWSMTLSAALAYNLLLATFPLLVAGLSLLGLLLGSVGLDASRLVVQALGSALPPEINAARLVQGVEQNLTRSSGLLGLIAVLSALIGGSRLFILLEACFAIIYRFRPRTMIRQNGMAIGMLLLFLLLVPLMLFAGSLPALAFSFLQNTPVGHNALLASGAGLLGGLLASFLFFLCLYVVVPNQHIRLRHSWRGAVVAAVALQVYLLLFPLYASHFLIGIAGAMGFAAILIVFFYYFAVILILGAEINAFFAEDVRPIPNDLATFVSTMAGRLNEDIPSDEAKGHVDPKPTEVEDKEHAISFVKETQERDVPERVAQDPEVQESVLKRRKRKADHREGLTQEPDAPSSASKGKPSQKKGASSSRSASSRGAILGAIVGSVLVVLIELLDLRRK